MERGSINYSFQIELDDYQIYRGRQPDPVTKPPLPYDHNLMRAENLFPSNYSTGIPTDEIELRGFEPAQSFQRENLRNSYSDQQMLDHRENNYEEKLNISESGTTLTDQNPSNAFTFLKMFTILVLAWDIASDWVLVFRFDRSICYEINKLDIIQGTSMCGTNREIIRQIYSVFSMAGSFIAVLQCINIILDILCHLGIITFKLGHAQYDLYISLYFKEIPQAIILLMFNYGCSCDHQGHTLSILAMASGLASCLFRYITVYNRIGGEHGCCNLWWRCCCCRQQEYLCTCNLQECCCKCDIPCPVFCCTLLCYNGQWTINSWCGSWLKMFSCFCICCSDDKTMFGVRTMNNFGLLILIGCTIAMGAFWA